MTASDIPVAPRGGRSGGVGEDRIVTIPNVISFVRLLAIPAFCILILLREDIAAVVLLACFGATDWVDGYIARRYHQVSNVGKILDPVADRLLFFVGIGGILASTDPCRSGSP